MNYWIFLKKKKKQEINLINKGIIERDEILSLMETYWNYVINNSNGQKYEVILEIWMDSEESEHDLNALRLMRLKTLVNNAAIINSNNKKTEKEIEEKLYEIRVAMIKLIKKERTQPTYWSYYTRSAWGIVDNYSFRECEKITYEQKILLGAEMKELLLKKNI